jgi:hypothetical protein
MAYIFQTEIVFDARNEGQIFCYIHQVTGIWRQVHMPENVYPACGCNLKSRPL